ncbi:hypothetical protein BaRGS_00022839 [Batillaria attramentaria]|uniref:adenylate cyclase n=1 Tax=Batillaria attramentaria TaxID=370345 RepID=A0ABD0KG06_9CAEN
MVTWTVAWDFIVRVVLRIDSVMVSVISLLSPVLERKRYFDLAVTCAGSLLGTDLSPVCFSDDHLDASTVPFKETWSSSTQEAKREQLDEQIIKYLNEDVTNLEFFYRPPINSCTLSFTNPGLEEDYRSHYFDSELFREESVASPRYHSFIEVALSVLIFILISVCCFLVFGSSLTFIVVFVVCLVLEMLVLADVATDVKFGSEKEDQCQCYAKCMSAWSTRNVVGIMMAVLPAIAVYTNLSCDLAVNDEWYDRFFCFCIILSLLNFCNFSMLSSWVKSIIATLVGLILLILLSVTFCDFTWTVPASTSVPTTTVATNVSTTTTTTLGPTVLMNATNMQTTHKTPVPDHLFSGENILRYEIILDVVLLLLLIWFLNREFEISYRLSFHGSAQAMKDTQQMQENKDQADWLLHNIIPEHVSDVVKRTSKYSKNHKDIGVIFATIVNFNEFYDEGFEGGREYLRVLNELVSDYEELLDRQRFKDVEKIKTISASFMAASGLNEASRRANHHPYAHLFGLMDFAMELQNVVHNFNESIFNFNFTLNIGYNFGEVTAGVIGTTKLLYDIWGDTVNIASRMYSTGEPDRIQVPEATVNALSEMFEFEYRGEIFVKGKGNMRTFLLKSIRPGATWD